MLTDAEKNFNSHALVERDPCSRSNPNRQSYFNSHALVERDYLSDEEILANRISTHTLSWSVT